MRSVTKAWLALGACVVACGAITACSSDETGGGDPGQTENPNNPNDAGTGGPGKDATATDANRPDTSNGNPDASTTDANNRPDTTTTADVNTPDVVNEATTPDAPVDAPVDAQPDAPGDGATEAATDASLPPTGSPCTTRNEVQQQSCGICGFQQRVCSSATDGGAMSWQPWGFCQREVPNGCVPGTTTDENCGMCGHRQKICQSDCSYAVGACLGQPTNACTPGSQEFKTGLSCDAGGRSRSCSTTCQWGDYGACFAPGDAGLPGLMIAGSAGGTVSQTIRLVEPKVAKLASFTAGACTLSTTTTVNAYLTLSNPIPSPATVSVWVSAGAGQTSFDTVMASYAGATNPPTNRLTCGGYNDDCATSPCVGGTDPNQDLLSGLVGASRPVIPGLGSVTIYVGAYSATQAAGDLTLNVRTDTL